MLKNYQSNLKFFSFLFYLLICRPEKLQKYDRCGTVQDLVVSLLCDQDDVRMSTQNAASWGYFLTNTKQWDYEALSSTKDFPTKLLPAVILTPGQPAGVTANNWFGIPAGVTVGNYIALRSVKSHYNRSVHKKITFSSLIVFI